MHSRSAHGSRIILHSAFGFLLTAGFDCRAADEVFTAQVGSSDAVVSCVRRDADLLLSAEDAASAYGWDAKIVADGSVLALCRDGENGLCVPIRLSDVGSIEVEGELFVDSAALARPLQFKVIDFGGVVRLVAGSEKAGVDPDVSAYNALWGSGRGFQVGQTVPDIPLVDLEGNEVRFSRFLGKQYIIYCWASW